MSDYAISIANSRDTSDRAGTDRWSFFVFAQRNEATRSWMPYALLIGVTIAVFGSSLSFGFVWDDELYITRNLLVRVLDVFHLKEIWTRTFLGHYAPLNLTFLAIVQDLAGFNPFWYHAAQLLLHAACVCLLYAVVKKVESPQVSLLATLLFAVHPVNVETVAWINETKSTLAFFFFLLSFWLFIRFRERSEWKTGVAAGLFLTFSLLSKINTVVAPAIFLLYDYRQRTPLRGNRLWTLVGYFSISGIFILLHVFSFFFSGNALAKSGLEDSYYGGPEIHVLNFPLLIWFYVRTLAFPSMLTAWHMMNIHLDFNLAVASGWVGLSAMAWLLYRSNRNVQFWSLWFLIFLMPVLQIVPNLTWVAERYLYIPAVGGFVLFSQLFFWLNRRLNSYGARIFSEVAVAVILVLLTWKTVTYLPSFKSNLTLWEVTAKTCPTSAVCRSALGSALVADNQIQRGMNELIEAVKIRAVPSNLGRLGDAYTLKVGDYRQAIIAYEMALEQANPLDLTFAPKDLYARLARAQLLAGDTQAAARSVDAGIKLNSDDSFLLAMQAMVAWKLGDTSLAREALLKCLHVLDISQDSRKAVYVYWHSPGDAAKLLADLGVEI
jgi:protein O-mannosyl-transferase